MGKIMQAKCKILCQFYHHLTVCDKNTIIVNVDEDAISIQNPSLGSCVEHEDGNTLVYNDIFGNSTSGIGS